jgi:hypothetical protein
MLLITNKMLLIINKMLLIRYEYTVNINIQNILLYIKQYFIEL